MRMRLPLNWWRVGCDVGRDGRWWGNIAWAHIDGAADGLRHGVPRRRRRHGLHLSPELIRVLRRLPGEDAHCCAIKPGQHGFVALE